MSVGVLDGRLGTSVTVKHSTADGTALGKRHWNTLCVVLAKIDNNSSMNIIFQQLNRLTNWKW